ncbi:endosomal/lysosomal proton channel TMEM175 isoform X4 [Pteronotus mesoamericanus]|uniref:endosomal/lysosomal proton channel TMEM175 isoform X4 n=1 Tax=Pteronotus mesoamericanus TaxID=1884717 RepID=UPI0023EBF791|nr:endosomal/lysosomal proton channel TMEM175 isoform X4 [Pteronotus parnellii mesoamericanus]
MSGPQAPEPAPDVQGDGDAPTGPRGEDAAAGTQHSQRMLSFSDALLSIIATVMILPVTHTELSPQQQFDKSIQKLLATRIAVYLMTFLIVTVAWAAHTRLFQVVGKIDDTLALLNLACMMTITFLPFTFSLMVTFPEAPLGIFLFCTCVIAIGAVQALIVAYAFRFPHLLNPQIGRSAHRRLYRRHILRLVLRGPVLCFLAAGFSLFFYPASYLLLATVIVLPYVSKAASWCRDRLAGPQEPPVHSVELLTFTLQEPLSKERVEAFSDGVYAIVATLLILDICSDNVPDPKDVAGRFHGSLVAALSESGPQFLAYFGSFATFAMWTTALLHEAETLQPSARFGGREHAFMFAKLALYPCASLLAFASTCFLSRFSTAIFHLMQIAVPFAFLLLRLLVRLALALLRALRGLRPPAQHPEEGPRAPLLPAPC